MKILFISIVLAMFGRMAVAEEALDPVPDRDPAVAVNLAPASKRTYAGGADEEDLQVQTRLPEALQKTDSRSLQRGVYKTLYNQELKDERQETPEE